MGSKLAQSLASGGVGAPISTGVGRYVNAENKRLRGSLPFLDGMRNFGPKHCSALALWPNKSPETAHKRTHPFPVSVNSTWPRPGPYHLVLPLPAKKAYALNRGECRACGPARGCSRGKEKWTTIRSRPGERRSLSQRPACGSLALGGGRKRRTRVS